MRRLNGIGWTALTALLVAGCGGDAPAAEAGTTGTAQVLLQQPKADELATMLDTTLLQSEEPTLGVDVLGVNMGSAEAPVKVIEFVDYGCGYCRKFQIETFPTIREEFIETDMIEWKFMPFITGMFPNSPAVTIAAECALAEDPRAFATLSEALWERQREWKNADDPAALVRDWALRIGVDESSYDTCLQDDLRRQRVASATALASQLGVRSTPTFWIVGAGPIQGALPLESFRQIFTQVHRQITESAG
ncbi:MAG: thioredoxin domain-containing protein [Gemmatimonadota bacterium]|jgi:protein-disulfide isomerase